MTIKLLLGTLLCAQFALAETASALKDALSFDQAARKTLAAHPQFKSFALALDASRAREAQAGLKPALELSGDLENILGTGDVSGVKGSELTISLGSIFERGNKRAARTTVAQSASALLSVQSRIEALDLLTETGRNFVALAAAQELKVSADRAFKLAQTTLDMIKPRVAAAQLSETDQLNAEIVHVEAMLQVGHAKRRVEAAQRSLSVAWNEPQATPSVRMDIYAMPKLAEVDTLLTQIDALPDITQYAAQARVADAEIALAKAQTVTDWRWSAGVRRLEAINDQAFVVGVSIPLGQAKRQNSFVREAQINAQQPELGAQSARLRLRSLLFSALQDIQSATAEEHVVRDHQLPQANQVMKLTMRGYEMGRYAYRDVALAQAQVQALELKRLQAAVSYHLARIEIERLTGAQLQLISE
jgi:outer membrane protein, heavy metal efflux system